MSKVWKRGGMALIVVTMGLTGCGGVDAGQKPSDDVSSAEQGLVMCDSDGRCPANHVCRGRACYSCQRYPQYCGQELP